MTVTQTEFDYVRRLVADESALALGADKEYLVRSRLAPLATQHGLDSVSELIGAARGGEPGLRTAVVEALFTHETLFFRDRHPFDALREVVLPERARAAGGRPLSLWSAATSTGQEAYSLAILLSEVPVGPAPLLLATDLSQAALARARAGRYSALEVGRGLPDALLQRHFIRSEAGWTVRSELRRMVRFERLNLARPFHRSVPRMDVILLRNVLIYFEEATRAALTAQLARVLRPGGWLCLGGAETIGAASPLFDQVRCGRTVLYRRRGSG